MAIADCSTPTGTSRRSAVALGIVLGEKLPVEIEELVASASPRLHFVESIVKGFVAESAHLLADTRPLATEANEDEAHHSSSSSSGSAICDFSRSRKLCSAGTPRSRPSNPYLQPW